jgi:hypothetical protein
MAMILELQMFQLFTYILDQQSREVHAENVLHVLVVQLH